MFSDVTVSSLLRTASRTRLFTAVTMAPACVWDKLTCGLECLVRPGLAIARLKKKGCFFFYVMMGNILAPSLFISDQFCQKWNGNIIQSDQKVHKDIMTSSFRSKTAAFVHIIWRILNCIWFIFHKIKTSHVLDHSAHQRYKHFSHIYTFF